MRDLLVLWKLKIMRVVSYFSIVNSFMIFFVFVKEFYLVLWIVERFLFREFVGIVYVLVIVGFIVLVQFDWYFMYKREQSYVLIRNLFFLVQCFMILYFFEKVVEEGRIIEEEVRRVIVFFQLVGCDVRNVKIEVGLSGNGN